MQGRLCKPWSLVCALLALQMLSGAAMAQQLAPVQNEDLTNKIPGQYIVVFKPGTARSVVTSAQERIKALGGTVMHTYTSALVGFSVKLPADGDRAKRARPLQVGDEVRVRQGVYEYQVTVRALSARRGPASEAAGLYQETDASRAAREAMALQLKTLHAAFVPERGRPTKKDRRDINRLKGR